MNKPPPKTERSETDASLRTERRNTDHLLQETREHVEEVADDILDRARDQADAVLDASRSKADDRLEASAGGAEARDVVARERAREDEALSFERAAADEALNRERTTQARALAALLPLERAKTDRYLFTERARADHAVAHRDDFLGIVSHDLRNLLGAISAAASLLQRDVVDSDHGRRTIATGERIQRYVARMNRLVGDLVDVASIDAGKLAMEPRSSDAVTLINDAVEAFAHAADDKVITLTYRGSAPSLPATFDYERMLQVLANLIANAIKFTGEGGVVDIVADRVADDIHVTVVDNGAGIPGDMLEAIFERFWQVRENDRRGLGLGLYISKCIVEAHGGRIWAESTVGSGSTFHFTIPASGVDAR